jgi:hypothetical protein
MEHEVMKQLIITITAETQFHNGAEYQYYPSVEITITDSTGNVLFVHSCPDVHGATGYGTIAEAQAQADAFLSNATEGIGRAIIADINE